MSEQSVTLSTDRWLKMKPATLWAIVVIVALATTAYAALKSDNITLRASIDDHTDRLKKVETTISVDHDLSVRHSTQLEDISKTLSNLDKKLDYLTGARAVRPAAGPGTP